MFKSILGKLISICHCCEHPLSEYIYLSQIYLNYNKTQLLTFVGRMARLAQEAIDVCTADITTAALGEYFNQWIAGNPG